MVIFHSYVKLSEGSIIIWLIILVDLPKPLFFLLVELPLNLRRVCPRINWVWINTY